MSDYGGRLSEMPRLHETIRYTGGAECARTFDAPLSRKDLPDSLSDVVVHRSDMSDFGWSRLQRRVPLDVMAAAVQSCAAT